MIAKHTLGLLHAISGKKCDRKLASLVLYLRKMIVSWKLPQLKDDIKMKDDLLLNIADSLDGLDLKGLKVDLIRVTSANTLLTLLFSEALSINFFNALSSCTSSLVTSKEIIFLFLMSTVTCIFSHPC
jgi:hypothetical protein